MSEIQVLSQDVLVACILLGLTAVVGLLGNALMLRALLRYRSLRQDFFVLLGSVAAADSLCLVISVPMHIIYLTMATDPVNDSWCKASKYIDAGSGFVAAYHLVVLAVLRGILLTSRGRNPPTARQTLVCLLVLWIIAFLAAIPFLMTVEDVNGFCHYTITTNVEREVLLLNSFSCYVPVALIMLIYLATHLVGQRYFQDSYSYKEKRMSRLVTVIVVVFVLLQLPFRVLDTHVMFKELEAQTMDFPDEDTLVSLYIARNYLLCLLMFDKAARPIICSKLAPGLSEAFDEVINCTKCQQLQNNRGGAGGGRPYTNSTSQASGTTTATASTVVVSLPVNGNNNDQVFPLKGGGGGGRSGGGGGGSREREGGRHPSTSSKAPLTGGRGEGEGEEDDGGFMDDDGGLLMNIDRGIVIGGGGGEEGGGGGEGGGAARGRGEPVDEMEIVQL